MSHTPGPLTYDNQNYFPPAILDADDNFIAFIAQDRVDDPEANGHLFAAAPDLLEATEYLLSVIEEFADCGFIAPLDSGSFPTVRAAIAKARGEQP